MRDLGRRAFSSLMWAGAADAAGKLLVFVATLVLARLLVPSEFGLVAFALSIIYALDYVGDLGLGAALIYRADAEDPRVASTAFWIGIGGSLVLFGISWLIAPLLAEVGPGDEVIALFRVLALQFPFAALGKAHEYRLRRELRFRTLFGPKLANGLTKGIVSIALAVAGAGAMSLVIGQVAGWLVQSIGLWLVYPFRPRFVISRRELPSMMRFGLGIVAVGVLGQGAKNFDYIIVGGEAGRRRAGRLLPRVPAAGAGDPDRLPRGQRRAVPLLRAPARRAAGGDRRRPAAWLPGDDPARRDGGLAGRLRACRARASAGADPLRRGVALGGRADGVGCDLGGPGVARDHARGGVQGARPLVAADGDGRDADRDPLPRDLVRRALRHHGRGRRPGGREDHLADPARGRHRPRARNALVRDVAGRRAGAGPVGADGRGAVRAGSHAAARRRAGSRDPARAPRCTCCCCARWCRTASGCSYVRCSTCAGASRCRPGCRCCSSPSSCSRVAAKAPTTPRRVAAPTDAGPHVRRTFYVAPGGSDAGPGTRERPFGTIAHALRRLRYGQRLCVRGGTYDERVKLVAAPGRKHARVRVSNFPGERPVLRGQLWIGDPSYWTIRGLSVEWAAGNPDEPLVRIYGGTGWRLTRSEIWGSHSTSGLQVDDGPRNNLGRWLVKRQLRPRHRTRRTGSTRTTTSTWAT